jgi:hypothetical protein
MGYRGANCLTLIIIFNLLNVIDLWTTSVSGSENVPKAGKRGRRELAFRTRGIASEVGIPDKSILRACRKAIRTWQSP